VDEELYHKTRKIVRACRLRAGRSAEEHTMSIKTVRRIPVAELQAQLRQIVQEVMATDIPIIIQTQGEDQAVIISRRDFQRIWPSEEEKEAGPTLGREQVQDVLQAAGLLSEPMPQELAEVRSFESRHPPEDQERILAEWRRLDITPSLSEIVLYNREQVR